MLQYFTSLNLKKTNALFFIWYFDRNYYGGLYFNDWYRLPFPCEHCEARSVNISNIIENYPSFLCQSSANVWLYWLNFPKQQQQKQSPTTAQAKNIPKCPQIIATAKKPTEFQFKRVFIGICRRSFVKPWWWNRVKGFSGLLPMLIGRNLLYNDGKFKNSFVATLSRKKRIPTPNAERNHDVIVSYKIRSFTQALLATLSD